MGIINSGNVIKDARKKAGMTQEELSDGICSVISLNRIENGKLGVSPVTFSLLMEKTGNSCEAYPWFKNVEDFDCYMQLKYIHEYISLWSLENAYNLFLSVKEKNYANNKYYLQSSMILYSWLQYRSYNCDYSHIEETLLKAFCVTKAESDIYNDNVILSFTEIFSLLLSINVHLNTSQFEKANSFFNSIEKQIKKTTISDNYVNFIKILLMVTYSKYYYLTNNIEKAKQYIDEADALSVSSHITILDIEIALFSSFLECKLSGFNRQIIFMIHAASYKKCGFINFFVDMLKKEFPEEMSQHSFDESNYYSFDHVQFDSFINYDEGLFDINDINSVSMGKMIQLYRQRQKIPINVLCYGICSKSKLSKIENDQLNPDIYTLEALLTRLGMSERYFNFYGNNDESNYNDIKNNLTSLLFNKNTPDNTEQLESLKQLADKTKDKFIQQQYLIFLAEKCDDDNLSLEYYHKALELTFNDFNLKDLLNYRYSRSDITILNGIARSMISCEEALKTNEFINKLLDYKSSCLPQNNLFGIELFSITECLYMQFLYHQDMFMNIVLYIENKILNCLEYKSYPLSILLYYYIQALIDLKQDDKILKYAKICIGFQYINKSYDNALYLFEDLEELCNIKL